MFDAMEYVAMKSNKILSSIVTELFLRGRKLDILLVSISQPYFKVSETTRLNVTHYFIMKIPNKRQLQQTAPNNLSDIDCKYFRKLYKEYPKVPYSFLVIDTTFLSDNLLQYRKNLL